MELALVSGVGLAFFLTPFSAFLKTFVFRSEACEGLAHLLLYVFFAYFGLDGTLGLLVAAAVVATTVVTAVVALTASIVASAVVIAAPAVFAAVVGCLLAGFFDIYFLFAGNAAAFFAVALGAGCALRILAEIGRAHV